MTATEDGEGTAGRLVMLMTVREHDKVEFWLRKGMTGSEMATLLRRLADGFESGEIKRIG